MNKEKKISIIAGSLEIFFAIGLVSLIGLFYTQSLLIQNLYNSFLLLFNNLLTFLPFLDILNFAQNYHYISFSILGITAILTLTFGSITIHKSRKTDDTFYKSKGSFITFILFEILSFAFFTSILVVLLVFSASFFVIPVIIPSLLFIILILRFISLGFLNKNKKLKNQQIIA